MSDNNLPIMPEPKNAGRGSADQPAEPHFLAVGRVIKPHGINGEVKVELLTDLPERFEWLESIYLGEKPPRLVKIESVRFHQGSVLLKLAGFPTRTEAEQLRGELLQVPESEAIPLGEGEYFLHQLIDLAVYTDNGEYLGQLVEVLETGANNVFVVRNAKSEYLLPDIPDVIREIDIADGRLVINPMPGLLDGLGE